MTVHIFHPDTHEHGLFDGCPRCEEHAQDPLLSLDTRNLVLLAERVRNGESARSENERLAMERIERAIARGEL